MDDSDRLDRIEAQIRGLQAQLSEIRRTIGIERPAPGPAREPAASAAPAQPAAPPERSRPGRPGARQPGAGRDLEAWLGQNALLVVGVLALVAAVAFALRYAFDQGWISPSVRVLGGLAIGLGLAAWGERARGKGLGRFGGAVVGAGAAIGYLAIWAAAGPYRFVPIGVGIAALAALSGLVLLSAWRSDESALAATAGAGAFLAPLLLGDASGSANVLLGYGALVAVGTGGVGAVRGWRLPFGVAIAGFFVLWVGGMPLANDLWTAAYLAGGGAAALVAARRAGWQGLELMAWAAVWIGLVASAHEAADWRGWAYVILPALVVAPGWLAAGGAGAAGDGWAALHGAAADAAPRWRPEPADRLFLALSGAAWVGVALLALPDAAEAYPLLAIGAIALVYLYPALARRLPDLLAVGLGVLALGALAQWTGAGVTAAWAGLVLLAGIATRREPLAAARWAAALLGLLAAYRLGGVDLLRRPEAEAAFTGTWALAMYAVTASLGLLAGPLWRDLDRRFTAPGGFNLRIATWILGGLVLLLGGTSEITRVFEQGTIGGSDLGASLAVSAFWLLYAAALLAYGFRRERRGVRIAGLTVAGLAIVKVIVYDLSSLEALYRVGSFALLAVIALLGARAYHGRARAAAGAPAAAGARGPEDPQASPPAS
ncbi:MAG: DUF2339 domain-containing protein [Gemmatimonadota bacterium]